MRLSEKEIKEIKKRQSWAKADRQVSNFVAVSTVCFGLIAVVATGLIVNEDRISPNRLQNCMYEGSVEDLLSSRGKPGQVYYGKRGVYWHYTDKRTGFDGVAMLNSRLSKILDFGCR